MLHLKDKKTKQKNNQINSYRYKKKHLKDNKNKRNAYGWLKIKKGALSDSTCLFVNRTPHVPQQTEPTVCFKILTRPRVLTVAHHEPVPGWTSSTGDLTYVLTNRGQDGL